LDSRINSEFIRICLDSVGEELSLAAPLLGALSWMMVPVLGHGVEKRGGGGASRAGLKIEPKAIERIEKPF
jgi:hypothetical protein